MKTQLRLTGRQHEKLFRHLLSGDGKEAAAVGLAGRGQHGDVHTLLLREVHNIPFDECRVRESDRLEWNTERIVPLLNKARAEGMAVVFMHSHPGGGAWFSPIDDQSDTELASTTFGWVPGEQPHASLVMLPGGELFGRALFPKGQKVPLSKIVVAGEDLHIWSSTSRSFDLSGYSVRTGQVFGPDAVYTLGEMCIGIVGLSGTGSPMAQQLSLHAPGKLVLVDDQRAEPTNLNRLVHVFPEDVQHGEFKAAAVARMIRAMKTRTEVVELIERLPSENAFRALGECDVIFSCVDNASARHYLSLLCASYNIVLIDMGVYLDADGLGGLKEACGAVHYVEPDGATLKQRGVYSAEMFDAESLKNEDPKEYERQRQRDYLPDVDVDGPTVSSVTGQVACIAMTELFARIQPFRPRPNAAYAWTNIDLLTWKSSAFPVREQPSELQHLLALGDRSLIYEILSIAS